MNSCLWASSPCNDNFNVKSLYVTQKCAYDPSCHCVIAKFTNPCLLAFLCRHYVTRFIFHLISKLRATFVQMSHYAQTSKKH